MIELANVSFEGQDISSYVLADAFGDLPASPARHRVILHLKFTFNANSEKTRNIRFRVYNSPAVDAYYYADVYRSLYNAEEGDTAYCELGPFVLDVSGGLKLGVQSDEATDTDVDMTARLMSEDVEYYLAWRAAEGSPTASSPIERIKTVDDAIVIRANTAQNGGDTTITLDAGASGINDTYNGATIVLTGGTGAGQVRKITEYDYDTWIAIVDETWTTNPDDTTTFAILGVRAPGAGADEVTVVDFTAAALAQLFTLDSTKTKDDAVSGSVVNETAAKAAAGLSTKTVKISES